jgi:lysophospholipase L1-like esterase
MKPKYFLLICLSALLAGASLPADELPNYAAMIPPGTVRPFADGDRIAFLGDSITSGGAYHKDIYIYWVTRHPTIKIKQMNKGIFSDFVPGGIRRMDFDVLKEKPNKMAIDYGMNDSGASHRADLFGMKNPGEDVLKKRQAMVADFRKNMSQLISILKERSITPILIGASIYDNTMEGERLNRLGGNSGIQACVVELKDLSEKNGYEFVDFNKPMMLANESLQKKDPKSTIVGGDRVHPEGAGHWLMAYTFLKAQNASPTIAKFAIDASGEKVTSMENCEISNLKASDRSVVFDYFPKALPLPFNDDYKKAASIVPITDELNQEITQVTGLKDGQYSLTFDGRVIGTYSAADFAKGINIALVENNPGQKQAKQLDVLIQERYTHEGHIRMLRQKDCSLGKRFLAGEREKIIAEFKEKLEEAKLAKKDYEIGSITSYLKDIVQEEAMDKRILEIEEQIYKDNKPSKHNVRIDLP